MDEDLQVDCDMDPEIKRHLLDMDKLTEKTREDSGIYSMGSYSLGYKSGDSSTSNVQVLNSVDEALGNRLCNMTIEGQELEHRDNHSKIELDVHDYGYSSKSIDINERPCPWSLVEDEPPNSAVLPPAPSAEALEAYMQDDDGDTQLHIAIIQLAKEIALQMINLAPNHDWLNLVNMLLQTPLHLAVITQQREIIRRLMSAGASIDVRDQHGNTPLHIATREGYRDIVDDLLTPVNYVEASENKYEIPYQRVPQDLQAKNYDGHTPLHLAAIGTHVPVMKLLLDKQAKINTQDGKSGRTVLHYAAETGNQILLEFLLHCKGIDLDSCTYGGLTPVVLAAGRKFGNVVSILIESGADSSLLMEEEDEEEDMIDDFYLNGQPLSVR